MCNMRKAKIEDWQAWQVYDPYIDKEEFINKVHVERALVVEEAGKIIGIFRWNLFWDHLPCMTQLYFDEAYRRKGIGRKLICYWENEMKKQGHKAVMTSTQVDEMAQHFYRKMGYKDCGALVLDIPALAQPMEMFLIKAL